jgi:cobalt-zinc-cadmium efflux system protein
MPVHPHGEAEAEHRVLQGLQLAVELSVIILVLESVGAYYSRSLSLTVDAVHNLPDILAFALSWTAIRTSSKGPTAHFTFGAHRFETFAGLANAALILGAGVAFGYEAVFNLLHGSSFAGTVDPVWLLAVALPTLVLRSVSLSVLRRIPGRVRDLNLSSVIVHLASDLAITTTLLAAGAVLLLRPGLWWADPLAALLIAGVLVYESLPLFRDGWDVLTERTPRHLSVEAIARSALSVDGVAEVHDVHVWAVCSSLVCMTAHVGLRDMSLKDATGVVTQIRDRMENDFGIVHSTFEVECLPGPAAAPQ